jgi:hypothetical protein
MGGKKSGGAKSYDYFGTIAGAVCWGEVDLLAVLVDGKAVWEGEAAPSGDSPTNLTSAMPAKYFLGSGSYFKFYHGTDGQSADAALSANHPGYRGVAYFVAKGFLFGREKTTAPNVELIVRRRPVVDVDLIGSAQVDLDDDGQANPVAALAEILTSVHGARISPARLDSASWQAAAEYAAADKPRRYVSALVSESRDLRKTATELLAMVDGVLYWTAAGKLGVKIAAPGVTPEDAATITRAMMTEPPKWRSGAWGDVPTTAVVRYYDGGAKFKKRDEIAHNLVSLRMRGEDDAKEFDLPHVTRRTQAAGWAAEMMRRSVNPPVTVEVSARAETVAGIDPGDKVWVDIQPESASTDAALALAVVTEVRTHPENPTKISLAVDPLSSVGVYSPTHATPGETELDVEELAHALVIPLPVANWPTYSIGVLATRSQSVQTGFDVHFAWDTDDDASMVDETYALLGRQTGFACRLTLDESLDADETACDFTLTDGETGEDSYLASLADEITGQVEANDDPLLIVLANVDGSGRVVITDGVAEMEFLSVVTRSAIDTDSHTYTVFRGRLGTEPRAWTTAAKAWLIPKANLDDWTHPDIRQLVASGETGFAKLFAVAAFGTSPAGYVREFLMPSGFDQAPQIAWTTPAGSIGLTDSAGDITVDLDVTDSNGDLVTLRVDSVKSDGTGATTHANLTFAASAARAWSETLNFAAGTYTLTVTTTDAAGNRATSSRTIQNDDSGGDLASPSFSPPGGGSPFLYSRYVTMTVTSPADRFEYVVSSPGSSAPTGSGTLVSSTTGAVTVTQSKRIWARAGDGVDWSAWVFADYTKL